MINPITYVLHSLIRVYRYALSPMLGTNCRFTPSCSEYSLLALERHGLIRGGGLALRRIVRCNPWCHGGYDPVP
jgi:uncharacterized protein